MYAVRTEHPRGDLLAHEELVAGAGLGEVAWLRARVEGARGDGEVTFYFVSPFIILIVSCVIVTVWVSAIITVIVVKTTRDNACSFWVVVVSIRAFFSLGVVNRIKVVFVVVGAVVTLSVIVKSVPTIKDRPTLTGVIFPVVVAVVRFSVSEIIFYATVVAVVIYLTVVVVIAFTVVVVDVNFIVVVC